MSRLIDADKLLKIIDREFPNVNRVDIKELVNVTPTAFDKEKVIEELGEEILKYQLGGMPRNDYESGYEDGSEYGFNMAVDIVYRGGVDETN